MKAAVVIAPGTAPEHGEFPDPVAGPGEQILNLVASAIHPIVRAKASGAHYSSTGNYPLVPGVDAVARTADGTLVYTGEIEEPWGTFADRMSARLTLPLPAGADPVAVAAGINPGMSSWMPLTNHTDERGAPDTVMIVGVTGAAGGLAVQNARALGARRVIGVGRGHDDLMRVAAMGVDVVEIVGDVAVDAVAIGAALGGTLPELVLDFLWGGAAEAVFRALAAVPAGLPISYVEIGSAAGEQAAVPASLLRSRHFNLSGSGIGSFDMRRYIVEVASYMSLIVKGTVQVPTQVYPLSKISDAWAVVSGPRPVMVAD